MKNETNFDANIYNTHANDADGFAYNGAARLRVFGNSRQVDSRVPVILVDGKAAPKLEGEPGGHFTLAGEPICYPNAYARVGRSNMVYRCDSRKVVVGRDWTPEK